MNTSEVELLRIGVRNSMLIGYESFSDAALLAQLERFEAAVRADQNKRAAKAIEAYRIHMFGDDGTCSEALTEAEGIARDTPTRSDS